MFEGLWKRHNEDFKKSVKIRSENFKKSVSDLRAMELEHNLKARYLRNTESISKYKTSGNESLLSYSTL